MKNWHKFVIAFIGTGLQGALTFSVSIYPAWAAVFSYLVLAIGGTMTIVISWPENK
jgi:TM2 domain-containing membrane protein YozV